MHPRRTRMRLLAVGAQATRGGLTAVSLHCHTQHSKESLAFLPQYAAKVPLISGALLRELERHRQAKGRELDFARAYWTPPLSARQVFESETAQIEQGLGLGALVSITDHDDIEASARLRLLGLGRPIPISLEWTVPYGIGFFHLGVHNLLPESASGVMRELAAYTAAPRHERLAELLAWLNQFPESLLVLNHPLWDLEGIGFERHSASLLAFLVSYGHWIHALEVNGYRSWRENQGALHMAEMLDYPVVSGGDRHAFAPNAMLNLTRATSFAEFAAEIRHEKRSEVLVLPVYREHLFVRTIEAVGETLRHYPHFPAGQQRWLDRIFVRLEGEAPRPLADYWERGGPPWIKSALWALRLLASPRFRPALRRAFFYHPGAVS